MGAARTRARVRLSAVTVVVLTIAAGLVAALSPTERADAALPPGFSSTPVMTGLTLPTAMAFSPDGKVYVAQKSGLVKVYPSASSNNGTTFINLASRVYDNYDRGLLGLAVDPRLGNGTGHDFVYVLYAKDAPPGQNPPVWNDNCPSTPGAHTDGCVVSGTLSRIPVNANGTAGSEQIMIDNEWCQQFTSHSVGHLAFGPDGYLYVTGGDGASYDNPDWGQFGGSLSGTPTPKNPCGDPPGGKGVANTSPTARGGSMRSQSPRRPAGEARVLNGALLRINPDTAAGVPGNPLYSASSPSSNASRIIAYGTRNSFRFTTRPGTSETWLGDVGLGDWEEINRLTTPTPTKAVNYGWPCLENQTHLAGFRDLDMCNALYNDTTDPPASAYFAYEHYVKVSSNDTCGFNDGSAISGLAFYSGTRYPAAYSKALFFADQARNCLYVMTAGTNGLPDPSTTRTFIDDGDNPLPVDLEVDPISKDIFYVNIGDGTVNRISYASSNRPPVASASATPTSGTAPLSVRLNASASSDPDGDALTYSWDIDGNGTFGDATGRTPTVSYANGGTYQARVLVTDSGGLSATSSAVTITVTTVSGPVNTVLPVVTGLPQVGGTLSSSTGTWTGAAPITYARQWQRCTGTSCADITDAKSQSYSPQLADQGATLRVRVTATNAGGSTAALSAAVGLVTAGAGNVPPVPVISTPAASLKWRAGGTINFAGSASDAQDGMEPPSRLAWNIVLGHCTTLGCHQHPVATRTGATGTIAGPDHQAPSYIEFTLTATDAVGATASVTRRVYPSTAAVKIHSSPSGLELAAGSEQSPPTPFSELWVVNSQVQLNAPLTQTAGGISYAFKRWSDGRAATHTLNVPAAATTYTATYTGTCRATTYSAAALADAPAVYWRLGEATGTTAADGSGHAQPGTYIGGVGLGQAGGLTGDTNRSARFDGSNDAVVRSPVSGIAGTALTVDLWMKVPNVTWGGSIVSYGTPGSPEALQLRDARALAVSVAGTRVNTGVALNDGSWHHLAVTWSAANGRLRVYKDGKLAFSGSVRAGATVPGGGSLVLGHDQDWVGAGYEAVQGFMGQLDDVAIYPKVLTEARIQAHRYAGSLSTCPSLMALSASAASNPVSGSTGTAPASARSTFFCDLHSPDEELAIARTGFMHGLSNS